ncbi:MAG TPA: hypothetical protein VME66_05765 [Candidatus Acidoferrales bacterium]|nr:hypothetical protein [Candidatus Acidoferrales bacterium]
MQAKSHTNAPLARPPQPRTVQAENDHSDRNGACDPHNRFLRNSWISSGEVILAPDGVDEDEQCLDAAPQCCTDPRWSSEGEADAATSVQPTSESTALSQWRSSQDALTRVRRVVAQLRAKDPNRRITPRSPSTVVMISRVPRAVRETLGLEDTREAGVLWQRAPEADPTFEHNHEDEQSLAAETQRAGASSQVMVSASCPSDAASQSSARSGAASQWRSSQDALVQVRHAVAELRAEDSDRWICPRSPSTVVSIRRVTRPGSALENPHSPIAEVESSVPDG